MLVSGCASSASAPLPQNPSPGEALYRLAKTADGGSLIFGGGIDASNNALKYGGDSKKVGNGACVNCHGDHAQGGSGPAISWKRLTKKTLWFNSPKYVYTTPAQVSAAILGGVRPDGSKLSPAMPRYATTDVDLQALFTYLKAQ